MLSSIKMLPDVVKFIVLFLNKYTIINVIPKNQNQLIAICFFF